jgi:hypothetical protein
MIKKLVIKCGIFSINNRNEPKILNTQKAGGERTLPAFSDANH